MFMVLVLNGKVQFIHSVDSTRRSGVQNALALLQAGIGSPATVCVFVCAETGEHVTSQPWLGPYWHLTGLSMGGFK